MKRHFWPLSALHHLQEERCHLIGRWGFQTSPGPQELEQVHCILMHTALASLSLPSFSSVTIKNWRKGSGTLLALLFPGLTSPDLFSGVGHGVKSVDLEPPGLNLNPSSATVWPWTSYLITLTLGFSSARWETCENRASLTGILWRAHNIHHRMLSPLAIRRWIINHTLVNFSS